MGYYVNNEHPDHALAPENPQGEGEGEDAELTVADDGDAADDDDDDDDENMDVDNGNESGAAGPSTAAAKPDKPEAAAPAGKAAPARTPAAAPAAAPAAPAAAPAAPPVTKMPDISRITRVISSEPTVTRFTLKHWDEPSSGTIVDPELSGDVMQTAPSNIHVP